MSSIVFAEEILSKGWTELLEVMKLHYEEVAHYKEFPVSPDYGRYNYMEDRDALRYYTVRDAGELVGYCVFIISPHLHFTDMLCAQQDFIFLKKEYRGKGLGKSFIKWCDDNLAQEDIDVVIHHMKAKPGLDFGPLLESMGYSLMDKIYTRKL
jgi:GNAT superfamily N-acetyltransferase